MKKQQVTSRYFLEAEARKQTIPFSSLSEIFKINDIVTKFEVFTSELKTYVKIYWENMSSKSIIELDMNK